MPLEAPVTTATLPSNPFMQIPLSGSGNLDKPYLTHVLASWRTRRLHA
jgi:hypothetical protein